MMIQIWIFFALLSVDVRVIGTKKMRCYVVTYRTVERAHNSVHRARAGTNRCGQRNRRAINI